MPYRFVGNLLQTWLSHDSSMLGRVRLVWVNSVRSEPFSATSRPSMLIAPALLRHTMVTLRAVLRAASWRPLLLTLLYLRHLHFSITGTALATPGGLCRTHSAVC